MTAPPTLPGQFDEGRFQRLLALVGPAMAQDLLDQLAADFSACGATIACGTDQRDWSALREASHVLISLAGSAGANALHSMAQALNAATHSRDEVALAQISPDLMTDLAALIALVRATPAPSGGS